MADYKQLYFLLFQEISAAINTLQEAQAKAEELYLSSESDNDAVLYLLGPDDKPSHEE